MTTNKSPYYLININIESFPTREELVKTALGKGLCMWDIRTIGTKENLAKFLGITLVPNPYYCGKREFETALIKQ